MNSLKKLLGQRIKEVRKSRGLTQPALAEMVNVDAKYISRIETGSSSPSLDTLENISIALDIEVKELFDFAHLKGKEELIARIPQLLNKLNTNDVRLAYRLINDII